MTDEKEKKFEAIKEVEKQASTLERTLQSISHWELGNGKLKSAYWAAHTALQYTLPRYLATLKRSLKGK